MNISEANAFNTLMRAVTLEGPTVDEAVEAAAFLMDRARNTLGAGPTGQDIRDLYAEDPA